MESDSIDPGPARGRLDRLLLQTWERHADFPAVEHGGRVLTYRELRAWALATAEVLRAHGVRPGSRVAVHLERSVELVVALTGVVLAGGAHVALDVADPVDRVRYMLGDTAPTVLLSTAELAARLGATAPIVPAPIVTVPPRPDPRPADAAATPGTDPEQPCYLVYTSGSTGRPKASLIPHRALVPRLRWLQRRYRLQRDDRVLYNTACGFDVSVAELYWPLVSGAQLVVARHGAQRDADYLAEIINGAAITTLHFVPSLLDMFLTAREPGERYDGVRRVLAGGEALHPTLVRRWHARSTGALHNMYGPSECAIYSTAWECPRDPDPDPVLIGAAVDDTELVVVDDEQRPVEPGTPGELFIGGNGLALGYHDRPELTAERFVELPFAHGRFYRSGDLVRAMPSGELRYLGRADRQIKIRGFRIELGEIEAVGAEPASVLRIAVVPTPEPVKLVAAVVPSDPGADERRLAAEVHDVLAARLPGYMVPTAIVVLDSLPVTANGKLDPAAVLDRARPVLERTGELGAPPRGSAEQTIARVWCDVLGVAAVGRDDDLFEIGGDSLAAVKIIRRLRTELSVAAPIRLIFEVHTVAGLAARLDGTDRG